jgi:hypothetical protein
VAERYRRLDFHDPRSWRLLGSIAIPAPGPDHLDFSADGRSLVVSTEFSGWVFGVSITSMRVTGRAHVGGLPVDVKLSPDGHAYYVANQGLGGVTIVNARTLHRIRFLTTGAGGHGLAVSRDTKYFYVSNRLSGTISKTVSRLAGWPRPGKLVVVRTCCRCRPAGSSCGHPTGSATPSQLSAREPAESCTSYPSAPALMGSACSRSPAATPSATTGFTADVG